MNYTTNYKLPQWVETDRIMMEDFNQMCADIDAGLAEVKETAESKAEAEDLAALANEVGAGGKNCRIAMGSYTGTGTYGSSNAVQLNFDFYPVLVLIASPSCRANDTLWPAVFFRGVNVGHYCYGSYAGTDGVIVSWSDNSVSYYSNYQPGEQNNLSGVTYLYIALGYTA